jgi:hypothetical protein
MSEPTNGGRLYEIHGSGLILEALRRLLRQAEYEGRGSHFLSALGTLGRQLQRNPNVVGEPVYRLPALRMQIRTVALNPLVIDFGVCEDRPLVFIKGVTLLSKSRRI